MSNCNNFTLKVWGCGGPAARDAQLKQKIWQQKEVAKAKDKKVGRYYRIFSPAKLAYKLSDQMYSRTSHLWPAHWQSLSF